MVSKSETVPKCRGSGESSWHCRKLHGHAGDGRLIRRSQIYRIWSSESVREFWKPLSLMVEESDKEEFFMNGMPARTIIISYQTKCQRQWRVKIIAGLKLIEERFWSEMVIADISENDAYLTVNEAAVLAGVNPATVHKWIKKGKVEAVQSSKTIRIPRQEFEGWLQGREKVEV